MKIDNEELQAVRTIATATTPTSEALSVIPEAVDESAQRYAAIGGTYKVIQRERLKAVGWKVTKTTRPVTEAVPDAWVDLQTGEIITKTEARRLLSLGGANSGPSSLPVDYFALALFFGSVD